MLVLLYSPTLVPPGRLQWSRTIPARREVVERPSVCQFACSGGLRSSDAASTEVVVDSARQNRRWVGGIRWVLAGSCKADASVRAYPALEAPQVALKILDTDNVHALVATFDEHAGSVPVNRPGFSGDSFG
jgi:hypothetical protein